MFIFSLVLFFIEIWYETLTFHYYHFNFHQSPLDKKKNYMRVKTGIPLRYQIPEFSSDTPQRELHSSSSTHTSQPEKVTRQLKTRSGWQPTCAKVREESRASKTFTIVPLGEHLPLLLPVGDVDGPAVSHPGPSSEHLLPEMTAHLPL